MPREISVFDPGCPGGSCEQKEDCYLYVDNIDRGVKMDWLKTATIETVLDWQNHISLCEEHEIGEHIAVVSGTLMTNADTSHPNPPFLCYSVLQQRVDLSGDILYKWVHLCFTVIDAGIIAAYNNELYKATMKKKREELAADAPARRKKLEDDMAMELEPEEDLGTVGMREAMEVAEEND